MKKKKRVFPLKIIYSIIILLSVLALGYSFLWQALPNLEYFKIKEIVILGANDNGGLSHLKGANIWKLDLQREARRLALLYPSYQSPRLTRVLPGRLFVVLEKRRPAALIKLARYFSVDNDQVIVEEVENPKDGSLAVIHGLSGKIVAPALGKRYNVRELALALRIIEEFRDNRALSGLTITRLDVESASSAAFFILDYLEVKVGSEEIREKLFLLSGFISQSGRDLADISYIDLRFKDPVVKLR